MSDYVQKKNVKISIIIPVYNASLYLQECLDSVRRQNLTDYEVICIDDGSEDESGKILKQYANCDVRIRYFHQENAGPGAARNKGLKEARGTYVYFLDSDDYLLGKESLSFMVRLMEEDSLDILYFGTELAFESEELRQLRSMEVPWFRRKKEYGLYDKGRELFRDFVNNLDFVCNVWIQCARRSFLEGIHVAFPVLKECEDELYTFRTMLMAGRVRHVVKSLYMRRVHEGSIMTSTFKFRNFYDGTISWREMLNFLHEQELPLPVEEAVLIHLGRRYLEIRRQFDDLPADEQKEINSLSAAERDSVRLFLALLPCFQRMGVSFFFPYHLFSEGERVVLYGAGSVGREFYLQAIRTNYVHIVGLVDRNAAKMKGGLAVEPVADIADMDYDSILIAVRDAAVAEEIKGTLMGMGVDSSKIRWDGKSYLVQDFYSNFYFKALGLWRTSVGLGQRIL